MRECMRDFNFCTIDLGTARPNPEHSCRGKSSALFGIPREGRTIVGLQNTRLFVSRIFIIDIIIILVYHHRESSVRSNERSDTGKMGASERPQSIMVGDDEHDDPPVGSVPKTLLLTKTRNHTLSSLSHVHGMGGPNRVSSLPDHLYGIVNDDSLPDDSCVRKTSSSLHERTTTNSNTDHPLRCKYCFQYYDVVSSGKSPANNIYFLQCKRHRKSHVYWCKYHQAGFASKKDLAEHCHQTGGFDRGRRRGKVLDACGGMPYSYSWTYHYADDGDNIDSSRCVAGKQRQSTDILSEKLRSWTYED